MQFIQTMMGLVLGLLAFGVNAEPFSDNPSLISTYLIGTYTNAADQGIELLRFDKSKMALSSQVIASGIQNPAFVIANRAKSLVFATEEIADGNVRTFAFNEDQQKLVLLNTVKSAGDYPCYLALDPSERFLAVANYGSGNFSLYEVDHLGSLHFKQSVQHVGHSKHEIRQTHAHVHSMVFHPNGKQLLVADLGTDNIYIYDVDFMRDTPITAATPAHFTVAAGAGPRHMVLYPNGRVLYLVHELTGEIGVYAIDNGKVTHVNTHALTPPEFNGHVQAAEVRFSPDGRFIYVSNRGDANNLSVFEVNSDGSLSLLQQIATGGQTPRNFNLSHDGQFLLVANKESNDIRVFKRDLLTGRLAATVSKIKINKPAYIFPFR
jgi:6-phosphogluconolactonase